MNMLELFRVGAKLVLDKTDFDKGVSDADDSGKNLAENLSGYMEKAKKIIAGVFAVATVKKVASGLWDLAKETAAVGDKIAKNSQAIGFSIKGYQEWEYILGQSGASIDSLGMTIKTLNEAIAGNSAETAAGLSKLGLSAAQLASMSSEDQFNAIVTAFQKMPASVDKSRLAMQLLGRNAQSLMPLLNSAPGTVDDLRQRFHDLGLEMSEEEAHAAEGFGDALDDLSRTWDGIKRKFGGRLLPGFTSSMVNMANSLGRVSNSITDAFKTGDWSGVFSTITKEISGLVPKAVSKVTSVIQGLFEHADEAIGLAVSIFTGLADGLVKSIPILVAKIPTIIDTIWTNSSALIEDLANKAIGVINSVFGTNIPEIDLSGVTSAFQWLVAHKKPIVVAVSAIVGAFAAGKIAAFVTALSPLTVVFTLVAGAISLVALNWEKIKDWVGKTWKTTVEWVNNKWDDVKTAFDNAKAWVNEKYNAVVNWANEKFEDVKTAFADINEWVKQKYSAVVNWVLNAWDSVKSAFDTVASWVSDTAHSVKLAFTATVSSWIETIKNWLDGIGLKDITINLIGKVSEWIERIWGWVQNGLDVAVNFFGNLFGGGNDGGGGYVSPEGQGTYRYGGDYNPSLDMIHAKGLNYVPYDGYRAVLHRGETILNQDQGREWRQSGGAAGINPQALYGVVAQAVAAAVENIQINMDGKAVGNAVTQQVSRNIYQQQFSRRFATV